MSPDGKVIGGPLYDTEGIIVVDCNLRETLHAKRYFDVVGHYARTDTLAPRRLRPDRSRPDHARSLSTSPAQLAGGESGGVATSLMSAIRKPCSGCYSSSSRSLRYFDLSSSSDAPSA